MTNNETGDVGTLQGQIGTMVDGMNFDFSNGMDENYSVDGLSANDGTMLFTSGLYGRVVMNSAQGGRTICSTPVLGGYIENGDNTHLNLFQQYLTYLVDPEASAMIPSNFAAELISDDVYMDWMAPDNLTGLLGYNVYKNGMLLNSEVVEEAEYVEENIDYGVHSYWVTAIYEGDVESNSSNHATIVYSDPTSGYALDFDGITSEVVVTDAPDLNPTEQISVEAWVKLAGITSLPSIVSKEDWSTGETGYVLRIDDFVNTNTPQFQIGTAQGWIAASAPLGSIPFDTWTHVAGTYDGSNIKIYIDGELEGTQPCSETINISPIDLRIGGHMEGSNRYWNGVIDEVRLWSTARSQDQIQAFMANPLDGSEDGLIALWRMEEGAGSNVHDITENGHDGNAIGCQWVEGYPMLFEHGTVNGYVTSTLNGEGVDGALVRFGDYQVFSDNAGYFEIDLTPDTYEVFCSHPDYETYIYDGTIEVILDETIQHDIALTPLVGVDDYVPEVTTLFDNFPNPFSIDNADRGLCTMITFNIAESQTETTLKIYNIKGQLVRSLIDEQLQAGDQSIFWDGKDSNGRVLSSGIYFCRLSVGNNQDIIGKCLLLK